MTRRVRVPGVIWRSAALAAAAGAVLGLVAWAGPAGSSSASPRVAARQHALRADKTAPTEPVPAQSAKGGGQTGVQPTSPEHDPVEEDLPVGPNRPLQRVSPASEVRGLGVKRDPAVAAGHNDPVTVRTNTDLAGILQPAAKNGTGWETSVASSGDVVLASGNWFGAYSSDGGSTFKYLSPYTTFPNSDGGFCCDQVVQYVPQIDRFVWVLQYATNGANENRYRLAVISPSKLVSSNGQNWTYWDLTSKVFHQNGLWFDYDDVSFGTNYLYLSFNVIGSGKGILARFPLSELEHGSTLHGHYFTGPRGLHPAQNLGTRAFFADQQSTSQLRLYFWDELSPFVIGKDIDISSFDGTNYSTPDPAGFDWLGTSTKTSPRIMGSTVVGKNVWFSWSAGRSPGGKPFPFPYIDIVIISRKQLALVEERQIWNPDYAFAYPSLQKTSDGDVAIAFNWGGNKVYSNMGVGFLNGNKLLVGTTSGAGHVGGHYITVRRHYPGAACLSALGWQKLGKKRHPHYVLFGRQGTACKGK